MLSLAYLILAFLAGLAVVQRFLPDTPSIVRLAGGFVTGVLAAAWVTYLVAWALADVTEESLLIGMILTIVLSAAVIAYLREELRVQYFRLTWGEALFAAGALAFSFWLMDARLNSDPLAVSSETWGDTALHTSLSRSFAWGHNYPTEYPFFANEPIRYHFGYDFFAGALQRGGLSVMLSFNLPGALGFTSMMLVLFALGRFLFRTAWAGLFAVAFLMTNQSLEWYRYFEPNPDSRRAQFDYSFWDALKPDNWWHHSGYLSIGPYFPDKITIFNTLNVFLTQTHLIVGMALVLFVAFGLIQPLRLGERISRNRALFLGILFGASFWLNGVLFIAAGVFFGALLIIFALSAAWDRSVILSREGGGRTDGRAKDLASATPEEPTSSVPPSQQQGATKQRTAKALALAILEEAKAIAWFAVPAILLAIPQSWWLNGLSFSSDGSVRQWTGYLVCSSPESTCAGREFGPLRLGDWGEFAEYWWLNVGLMFPLAIFAFFAGNRSDRNLILAIMSVFLFANLVQLSRDLGGHNHKVINLWEILLGLYVAYALVLIWRAGRRGVTIAGAKLDARALAPFTMAIVPVAFFFLVLSGLVDFMTIKNDFEVQVFGDKTVTIEWIDDNTPEDAVFMTAHGELYTAPTLAGRGVYLGYEPWAGSAGYDVGPRINTITQVYGAQSKQAACTLLLESEIDYLMIGPIERSKLAPNESLFTTQFTDITAGELSEPGGPVNLYDVAASCPPALAASASE